MRSGALCLAVLALAGLTGCNFPAGVAAPTDLPPTPFAAPATYEASSTPAPTLVPTEAPPIPTTQPTETPQTAVTELLVSPLVGDVICRFGPGGEYSVEAKISTGVQVTASGRNTEASWLRVDNPAVAGKLCWAPRAELAGAEGADGLPTALPPNNIVTKVSVDLDPTKEEIPCADLPFKYTATFRITTTGPLTVKYTAQSSEGQVVDPTSYAFTASGTKVFTQKFKVDAAGDHWFRVDVVSPNAVSGTGEARLACTP